MKTKEQIVEEVTASWRKIYDLEKQSFYEAMDIWAAQEVDRVTSVSKDVNKCKHNYITTDCFNVCTKCNKTTNRF